MRVHVSMCTRIHICVFKMIQDFNVGAKTVNIFLGEHLKEKNYLVCLKVASHGLMHLAIVSQREHEDGKGLAL